MLSAHGGAGERGDHVVVSWQMKVTRPETVVIINDVRPLLIMIAITTYQWRSGCGFAEEKK